MSSSLKQMSYLTLELRRMKCNLRPTVTCRQWHHPWSRISLHRINRLQPKAGRTGSRIRITLINSTSSSNCSNMERNSRIPQETKLAICKFMRIIRTRNRTLTDNKRSNLRSFIKKYPLLVSKQVPVRTRLKWQVSHQVRLSRLSWCTGSDNRHNQTLGKKSNNNCIKSQSNGSKRQTCNRVRCSSSRRWWMTILSLSWIRAIQTWEFLSRGTRQYLMECMPAGYQVTRKVSWASLSGIITIISIKAQHIQWLVIAVKQSRESF